MMAASPAAAVNREGRHPSEHMQAADISNKADATMSPTMDENVDDFEVLKPVVEKQRRHVHQEEASGDDMVRSCIDLCAK